MGETMSKSDNNTRSKRRSRYEIWSEILEVCLYVPRSQTWILRKLGLKTNSVKENINFLLERELIEIHMQDELKLYKTSKKGEEALMLFYKLVIKYFDSKTRKKILHWSIYEE